MKYFSRARICLSYKILIMRWFVVILLMGVAFAKTDRCVKNASYTKCATACPLTCDNLDNPPDFCGTVCIQGCQCEEGFVLSRTWRCVKPEDCEKPPSGVRKICSDKPDAGFCGGRRMMWNFNQSTGTCQQFRFRGCGGNGNRYKTEKECLEKCKGGVCGENERYNECGTSCPLTCENYEIKDRVCTQECKEGCECENGFLRRSDGKCVRPEYCPNKYVPPLSVVIKDDLDNPLKGIVGPYNEGESLYLVCEAKGHPTSTLIWWRKGKVIDDTYYQRFGLVANMLILLNLQRTDFMVEFTCQATYLLPENITQSINASVQIDMNMKPLYVRITTPRKPVNLGEDITLVCETSGSRPEADISWWMGNKLIEDGIQSIFSERDGSEWNITHSSIQLRPGIDDNGKVIICKAKNWEIDYVEMQDTWILNIVHYNICEPNERYNECGTYCPLTCENYDIPDRRCPDFCNEGCECEIGFVRGDEGKCVMLEDCRKEKDKITDLKCSDCPDAGDCEATMTRFYYDSEDGFCKEFIYGGCGGNTNNFETGEECKATCGNSPEAQIKQELV